MCHWVLIADPLAQGLATYSVPRIVALAPAIADVYPAQRYAPLVMCCWNSPLLSLHVHLYVEGLIVYTGSHYLQSSLGPTSPDVMLRDSDYKPESGRTPTVPHTHVRTCIG